MLETKERKIFLLAITALVVILGAVSLWPRQKFKYQDTADYGKPSQNYINSQAYLDYLKSLPLDRQASQKVMQTVLTKEDVRQEVQAALNTSQAIVLPALDEKKIKLAKNNDSQAVSAYLSESVGKAGSFASSTADLAENSFNGNAEIANQLQNRIRSLTDELYGLSVPKDALPLHKAMLTAYLSYANLMEAAKTYDPGDYTKNDAVWPRVYNNYAIANDSAKTYADELNKLAAKHKIGYIQIKSLAEQDRRNIISRTMVPQAQAFLGLGDVSITIGDVPRIIMDAVKEGVRASFLQFMGAMLNRLVTKIEQNYIIANFLYYSDALVNGQYADDYLNKYVNDPLDRAMVKYFIPQFSCGNQPQDMRTIFQAKASQYLGFDPANLDPNDPQYYQKMSSVGDFLSSLNGWQMYYQDMAAQAASAAEKAVAQELGSSGLKTPRGNAGSTISSSINSIVSAEQASFTAMLQLGINNADSVISSVVANLTQTLMSQFVFQGVAGNQGTIAVYVEQSTCMSTAMLNPVLPLPTTNYQNSNTSITADMAMAKQCTYYSSLSNDCTSSTLTALQACAGNPPADAVGKQNCSAIANSGYINAMLDACRVTTARPGYCGNLQNLLKAVH